MHIKPEVICLPIPNSISKPSEARFHCFLTKEECGKTERPPQKFSSPEADVANYHCFLGETILCFGSGIHKLLNPRQSPGQ